jgi:hypothetical protein
MLLMIAQVPIKRRGCQPGRPPKQRQFVRHVGGVLILAVLLTVFGRYHNGWAFLLSTSHPASPADGVAQSGRLWCIR